MSRHKAYSEYKESGVEWLGRVPNHWQVCRIKNVSTINPAKSEARALSPETEVSFIPMEAIGENGELDVSRTKPVSEVISGYSYVADGDIMIAKITPCFENGKGAVARNLVSGVGFATTEVVNIRPNSPEDSAYLFYLLSADPFRKLAEGSMYGAGGQKRVADSFVAEYHLCLPGNTEREKIAAFLDHETAKIDALIEKQQRLIELLKEKRQAVISHAVTKGLNPNAPMKDSGVEWLGDVPAHWVVLSLGKITLSKCDGPFGSGLKSEHYTESGVRVIRLQNIKLGNYYDGDGAFISEIYYQSSLRNHDVVPGDVLIAGLGDPGNPVGRACVAPQGIAPAMVKADCFRFRIDEQKALPEFIAQQLSSSSYFDAGTLSNGSTRARIPLSLMATRKVAICPLNEQAEILIKISELTRKFDEVEHAALSAIGLMQERRTALISAAVTGKIDVRDWQAAA